MLILNKLFISSFGKFNNTNIILENGLNIIVGDNEAGKSTIHRFIKSMFYGFAKPESTRIIVDQSEYLKYKPWFSDSYYGSMEILYNDEKYLIHHNFNTDLFEIRNLSDNKTIDDSTSDPRNIGDYFLKMNSIVFDKLLNIQLINLQSYDGNNEFLKEYLLNNYYGNLRGFEITKTVTKLNNELERIGTDRISNKEMGIINKKINALNDKLSEQYKSTRLLEDLKTKRIDLVNEKKRADRIHFYSKKLYDYMNDNSESLEYEEDNNRNYPNDALNYDISLDEYNYLLEIENYLLEAITYKKEILDSNKSKNNLNISFLLILFIAILINILLLLSKFAIITKVMTLLVVNLIGLALLTYAIKYKNNNNDATNEIDSEISALNIEIERLEKEKNEILKKRNIESIKEYFNALNMLLSSEIDTRLNIHTSNSLKELNFTPLTDLDLFTKENLDLTEDNLSEIKHKLSKVEFEIDALENSLKNIRLYNEQLKELHIQKKSLENDINVNKIILDAIEFASSEFSKKINANISDEAGNILSFLTDNKYTKLIIDENLLPLIYDDKLNNFVKIESLSTGTIQIVYLALSIAFNMSRNTNYKYPLILDEVTNHLDLDRREQVLNYLGLISKDTQVIYFSNSLTDIDILMNLNVDYNIIRI